MDVGGLLLSSKHVSVKKDNLIDVKCITQRSTTKRYKGLTKLLRNRGIEVSLILGCGWVIVKQ